MTDKPIATIDSTEALQLKLAEMQAQLDEKAAAEAGIGPKEYHVVHSLKNGRLALSSISSRRRRGSRHGRWPSPTGTGASRPARWGR